MREPVHNTVNFEASCKSASYLSGNSVPTKAPVLMGQLASCSH